MPGLLVQGLISWRAQLGLLQGRHLSERTSTERKKGRPPSGAHKQRQRAQMRVMTGIELLSLRYYT